MLLNIIAIDGPAGSGKSTVARAVAKRLSFLHIDTGAIYRSVAFEALNSKINLEDKDKISNLAKNLKKINQSQQIRTEKVSQAASQISQYPELRANLLELQRRLGKKAKPGAVLEGRDIGTVVFPDAKHKIFLTASEETRAKRRYEELKAKQTKINFQEVLKDLKIRDKRDQTRKVAPLKPAKDAKIIDTSDLNLEEVVNKISKICASS